MPTTLMIWYKFIEIQIIESNDLSQFQDEDDDDEVEVVMVNTPENKRDGYDNTEMKMGKLMT